MRRLVFLVLIFSLARLASAQEQEKKLLDRLLKPDMTLQSNVQNKQFATSLSPSMKSARTKSFALVTRKPERGFWNTRTVSTQEFSTGSSPYAKKPARIAPRFKLAKVDESYATGGYRDVRPARDARKTVATSPYADTRPFLAKGKSQKSLSVQNRPMSIDEVRELLNKNK